MSFVIVLVSSSEAITMSQNSSACLCCSKELMKTLLISKSLRYCPNFAYIIRWAGPKRLGYAGGGGNITQNQKFIPGERCCRFCPQIFWKLHGCLERGHRAQTVQMTSGSGPISRWDPGFWSEGPWNNIRSLVKRGRCWFCSTTPESVSQCCTNWEKQLLVPGDQGTPKANLPNQKYFGGEMWGFFLLFQRQANHFLEHSSRFCKTRLFLFLPLCADLECVRIFLFTKNYNSKGTEKFYRVEKKFQRVGRHISKWKWNENFTSGTLESENCLLLRFCVLIAVKNAFWKVLI